MNAVTYSYASAGARLTKPATNPQTPLVPVFGLRAQTRMPQAAAFSLNGNHVPQGPFSFISERFSQGPFNRPDVPKTGSFESTRAAAPVFLQPGEQPELQTSTGKPRFRSALEQVSYLTNETLRK